MKKTFGKSKTKALIEAFLEEEAASPASNEEALKLFVSGRSGPEEELPLSRAGDSYWRGTLKRLIKKPESIITLGVLFSLILFACLQPFLPGQRSPVTINNDPVTGLQLMNRRPDASFWLGTNNIGQDLWARIWAGTRTSLLIGLAVAFFRNALGVLVGFAWGYIRRLDAFFTELYNILENIPSMILMMLSTYILRPGMASIIFSMCLAGWLGTARFIRNQVILLRNRQFNQASRTMGTPLHRIFLKNLLPHTLSIIILQFVLTIPSAISGEVFLTYIGLGLPADRPSLGNLINTGRMLIMSRSLRYQFYYPCAVLSIITVCFYVLGNAFADAADPQDP